MRVYKLTAVALLIAAANAVTAQTIDFSNARGTGTSPDRVLIENIRLLVPVPNPFNPGTTTTVETIYSVTFRFDPSILHLIPETLSQTGGTGATNCANAQVQVYNAVQGVVYPLVGASVVIGGQTATTNSSGIATLSNLPAGAASVAVTASGYVATSQIATLGCTSTNTVTIALSPSTGAGSLTSGQFRVVLTWGQNPYDLDSHLTGPASDGSRWHVYYSDKTAGDICGLDVDDTSSYGPETVTCPRTDTTNNALRPGVYRYSVHHYGGSANIGTAGTSVRLEFGNGTVYTYTPPTTATYSSSKDVWTVFELTVNTNGTVNVAPVNTVTNEPSSSSVRGLTTNPGSYGRAEERSLFQSLAK
jgi:hypothetical protein